MPSAAPRRRCPGHHADGTGRRPGHRGGLEAGADDYVVKPVEPRVLDARIRAVLRRMARADSPAETYGDLVIDGGSLIVRRVGRELSLTPTELRLLLVL